MFRDYSCVLLEDSMGGAYRLRFAEEQPRGITADHPNSLRMGIEL